MSKERLDILLTQQNLCESRALAQKLIRAGKVKVKGHVVDKPGTLFPVDVPIEVKAQAPFVSRGGEKLVRALDYFNIDVVNKICLDGGISTGGFTDCLLQKGAKLVYGVDVGYGQVAWQLRQDERVILRERTNFRHLSFADLYGENPAPSLGVMDLSFISLTKVLDNLWQLLLEPREVILLVKPQFEVGKGKVGKNGVVREVELQAGALDNVMHHAIKLGWQYQGATYSPITGPAGNIEYLLWLKQGNSNEIPPLELFSILAQEAQQKLNS